MKAQEYLNLKEKQRHIKAESKWQITACLMALFALFAAVLL